MRPALLVVDLQKAFFSGDQPTVRSLEQSLIYVNCAIGMFRAHGLPVIFVQHISPDDGLLPGRPGFELDEKIDTLPSDIRIRKRHGNSFHQTGLMEKLKELKVDTVFIAGYCAEHCVLSTYRGAKDDGLAAILIRGGLSSPSQENIRFVECISDTVSVGNLKYLLDDASSSADHIYKHAYNEAQ